MKTSFFVENAIEKTKEESEDVIAAGKEIYQKSEFLQQVVPILEASTSRVVKFFEKKQCVSLNLELNR